MKKILPIALAAAVALGSPAIAQNQTDFKLEKGAIVAEDFGVRLSRSELRKAMREKGIRHHKFLGNRGNLFVVQGAVWKGRGYRMRVDRATGAILRVYKTDGLYSVQKF